MKTSLPCLVWCQWVFCRWRKMYLICHLTSHDHLIEGSCAVLDGSFLQYVTTLISHVTINIVIVELE